MSKKVFSLIGTLKKIIPNRNVFSKDEFKKGSFSDRLVYECIKRSATGNKDCYITYGRVVNKNIHEIIAEKAYRIKKDIVYEIAIDKLPNNSQIWDGAYTFGKVGYDENFMYICFHHAPRAGAGFRCPIEFANENRKINLNEFRLLYRS